MILPKSVSVIGNYAFNCCSLEEISIPLGTEFEMMYEDENGEGNDKEVDDVLNEIAIADNCSGIATKEIWNGNAEVGKICTAADKADDWHDDVVDKGSDNGGKGSTNDDTYSEIYYAALGDEFFEFCDEAIFFVGFFGDIF